MADASELQQRLDNQRWLLAEYRREEARARADINRVMEKIHALKREAYQAGGSIS